MCDAKPSLEICYNLDIIVDHIAGQSMSKTKIKNSLGLSEQAVNEALSFGVDRKYLKREDGNFYRALYDYRIPESIFYPTVEQSLRNLWNSERFENNEFYIEQTARKDSKIAGPWTRPDLTLVSHKKFPWTIGHEFDVVTFEVKRPDSCNVLAVLKLCLTLAPQHARMLFFPLITIIGKRTNLIRRNEWPTSAPSMASD